jgi:hypothetical protein
MLTSGWGVQTHPLQLKCLRGVRYLALHVTAGRALSGSDERSCSAMHACEFARFVMPRATLAHASPPSWCRASGLHLETWESSISTTCFLGPLSIHHSSCPTLSTLRLSRSTPQHASARPNGTTTRVRFTFASRRARALVVGCTLCKGTPFFFAQKVSMCARRRTSTCTLSANPRHPACVFQPHCNSR